MCYICDCGTDLIHRLAVDLIQEYVLHQGSQKNESALEQAKDEHISDAIRAQYKNLTGKDFPIKDKT